MTASAGSPRRVLILVENLPSPFDRRVWQEATTLQSHGYHVSIICPTGKGYESTQEVIAGVHIYRYELPIEASGAKGYLLEYGLALFHTFRLAWKVRAQQGFDVIHACNPPDLLFLIGGFFKLATKTRFVFDHHDISPELYEAKFGRRDFLYRLLLLFERLSFKVADVSIATNESYRMIAIERGRMPPDRVHVVRSGPQLDRLRLLPPKNELKCGRRYLVGYVGVIGAQEGLDYLLSAISIIVHDMRRQDIHFGIIGDGTSLLAIKDMAVELGITDFVTFTGRVPDQQLLEMLNTAEVCVNPDVPNEMNDKSTMNKIMEYMALGKPIVQFDLTEGRVSAGAASLYARKSDACDMAHKLVELIDDPERRREMGRFGRHRVIEELQWEHEVPKLLASYEAVFASQPGRLDRRRNAQDNRTFWREERRRHATDRTDR
ncbi:MAG: glycosyltransferase WbuB [Herminiimonas sp.]|nr:glycosyltransferase WbuB [Herminiimonas sp.]MDB5852727.1 glycosyltransferase WbuB [Herminiimonas sp.]